jgi:Carboxypeptidase regulatory-like domain
MSAAPVSAPAEVSTASSAPTGEAIAPAAAESRTSASTVEAERPAAVDGAPAERVDVADVAGEPRSEDGRSPEAPAQVARAEFSGSRAAAPSAGADRLADAADAPVAPLVAPTHPGVEQHATNGAEPVPSSGLPTNGHDLTPTPARVAGRVRRRPSATPAEQAAADLALLRTFGVAHRSGADEPDVALEGCAPDDDAPAAGNAQPISFRVLGRDGRGIRGATVTLLDDHGRETANTRTNAEGHGLLTARHPGGYMLVTAADGFQPGAIAVAVTDEPVDAEIPLTRSASIAGSVGGEDGPIVGAQLALVQDGEIVDATESTAEGAYRFVDLAAGEYGLSVTAHECEPAAFVLEVADESELRQDVDLVPAGRLTTW